MEVVPKVERKKIMKVELNDRAIEKLKVADFVFTYVAKDGSTKTRDRITIPLPGRILKVYVDLWPT